MRVRIDTGPITHGTPAAEVPPGKAGLLIGAWRSFVHVNMRHDCRELLRIVEDAQKTGIWAHDTLYRFTSFDDFMRRGLEMDPELIGWAVEGLRALNPGAPIPFDRAVEAGRVLGAHGGDRRSERAREDQGCDHKLERYGTADHWLARLRRDDPELAVRVERGELSAHAAAIAKGWRKPRSAYHDLCAAWRRASLEERARFLEHVEAGTA